MNSAVISGRLVKDPFLIKKENKSICNFTLAVNEYSSGTPKTEYIDCVAWGTAAENLAKHQTKGDMIEISGELINTIRFNSENRKSYQLKVSCRSIKYIVRKNKNSINAADSKKEMSASELEISQSAQDFEFADFDMEL